MSCLRGGDNEVNLLLKAMIEEQQQLKKRVLDTEEKDELARAAKEHMMVVQKEHVQWHL